MLDKSRNNMLLIAMVESTLIIIPPFAIARDLSQNPLGALDLLYVLCQAVICLAAAAIVMLVLRIRRILGDLMSTDDAEELDTHAHVFTKNLDLTIMIVKIQIWVIITSSAITAVRAFLEGDIPGGIFSTLLTILLIWLNTRGAGGSGKGRSISKLIGEKSRALRDALVEAQKGMQPSPGAA